MARPSLQYLNNEYLAHNPTWNMEDAPWKAKINEWAEGSHLEPGTKWGLEYLQALKRVIG